MVATIKRVTSNIAAAPRHDTMEGRDYIVVPAIMMVEGVLNGNKGPLFYPAEEMGANVWAWNYRPVVVYHPQMNGSYISAATDPTVINSYKVGVLMNTQFRPASGKEPAALLTECWLEADRLQLIDNRILEAIEEGRMLELSTGLFSEDVPQEGEWGGKVYTAVARHFVPDHLAILPDQIGACSVGDGCGFLRANTATGRRIINPKFEALKRLENYVNSQWQGKVNGISHERIHSMLWEALNRKFGEKGYSWNGYVEDVYDSYCIYSLDGHTYKHPYEVDGAAVRLTGTPTEVQRMVEYTPVTNEDLAMTKKEMVDGLIANACTQWAEADRGFLMSLEEKQLEKFSPVPPKEVTGNTAGGCGCPNANKAEEDKKKMTEEEDKKKKNATGNDAGSVAEPPKPKTPEEYLAGLPSEMQEVISEGMLARNQLRTDLIKQILANEANTLKEEQLVTRSTADLRQFAALAGGKKANAPVPWYANYEGAQGGAFAANTQEEPLPRPGATVNTAKEKQAVA